MEIERKFLLKKIPDKLDAYERHELEQGYISTSPVIRIRRKDDTFILTVKSVGLLSHEEFELPLNSDEYATLLKKVSGNVITKTRYIIPAENDLIIELDVFHDIFEGFVMAEVEFPSEEEAKRYNPPSYFGREVTYDPAFYNASLSEMSHQSVVSFILNVTHNSD